MTTMTDILQERQAEARREFIAQAWAGANAKRLYDLSLRAALPASEADAIITRIDEARQDRTLALEAEELGAAAEELGEKSRAAGKAVVDIEAKYADDLARATAEFHRALNAAADAAKRYGQAQLAGRRLAIDVKAGLLPPAALVDGFAIPVDESEDAAPPIVAPPPAVDQGDNAAEAASE